MHSRVGPEPLLKMKWSGPVPSYREYGRETNGTIKAAAELGQSIRLTTSGVIPFLSTPQVRGDR